MATKIIHKKSSVAASIPSAGDLEPGEIAVNLADQKLYSKTTGGTVIELAPAGGTAPVTLTETCKNVSGGSLAIGTPVYQSGTAGNAMEVQKALSGTAASMPAVGLISSTLADEAEGTIVLSGFLQGLNTSTFSEGDTLYVSATGTLTTTIPAGESNLIQNIGKVIKVHASNGSVMVTGAGRANATPNLDDGNIFIGNASNQAVTASLTTEVQTIGDSRYVNTTGGTMTGVIAGFESTGIDDNATSTTMTLDGSGNVLVGKTSPSISIVGVEMRGPSGTLRATSQDAVACYFTRKGTAGGHIINFYRETTHAGVIGVDSESDLYIGEDGVGLKFENTGTDRIDPYDVDGNAVRDNAIDLGSSSGRFDDVYATNGTIQTSDRNEKQDIAPLTLTEMLVAARLSTGFKNFRWKDSVAEKGAAARVHSGAIAQDVQDAFTAEGLDAGDYSMFISATWWTHDVDVPAVEAVAEVVDEEGVVVTEAVEAVAAYTRTDTYDTEAEAPAGAVSKARLGVRYPELLSFVAAYNEQRFASIEARLTTLEAV
jgi:hypothetical protein